MAAKRRFDLCVYGATGFTGRLVAQYLIRTAPPSLRWAVCGRPEAADRLKQLVDLELKPFGDRLPSIIADTPDAICKQTVAIVSTAGPFALHGSPLIHACIANKTHYADITGETAWVQKMIDLHEAEAEANGVILVNCSGFDSVPADLGAFMLQREARKLGTYVTADEAVMTGSGGVSGGTIASMLNALRNPDRSSRSSMDRRILLPNQQFADGGDTNPVRITPDFPKPHIIAELGKASAPFVMAPVNTRIVRRSASLLSLFGRNLGPDAEKYGALPPLSDKETGYQWWSMTPGYEKFSYTEVMGVKSIMHAYAMAAFLAFFFALLRMPVIPSLLLKLGVLPSPGQGPSEEKRAKSWFHYDHVGTCADGRKLVVRVKGGCGGYGDTAKMLAEAGMLLARAGATAGSKDALVLPGQRMVRGGFLTPSTAFGSLLAERLHGNGVQFLVRQANGSYKPCF